MKKEIGEFIRESNVIEGVFDETSFGQAVIAWEYLMTQTNLTSSVVLKTHKILMLHSNLQPDEKGYFRQCEVRVGFHYGLNYVLVREAIGNWCNDTMHSRKSAKKLHIEFEKIHPFVDGNGRIGRLLMNWTRIKKKQPIIVIHQGKEQMEYYRWFR